MTEEALHTPAMLVCVASRIFPALFVTLGGFLSLSACKPVDIAIPGLEFKTQPRGEVQVRVLLSARSVPNWESISDLRVELTSELRLPPWEMWVTQEIYKFRKRKLNGPVEVQDISGQALVLEGELVELSFEMDFGERQFHTGEFKVYLNRSESPNATRKFFRISRDDFFHVPREVLQSIHKLPRGEATLYLPISMIGLGDSTRDPTEFPEKIRDQEWDFNKIFGPQCGIQMVVTEASVAFVALEQRVLFTPEIVAFFKLFGRSALGRPRSLPVIFFDVKGFDAHWRGEVTEVCGLASSGRGLVGDAGSADGGLGCDFQALDGGTGGYFSGEWERELSVGLRLPFAAMNSLWDRSSSVNVLPHEIGHILFSADHDSEEDSLMHRWAAGTKISASQCEKARSYLKRKFHAPDVSFLDPSRASAELRYDSESGRCVDQDGVSQGPAFRYFGECGYLEGIHLRELSRIGKRAFNGMWLKESSLFQVSFTNNGSFFQRMIPTQLRGARFHSVVMKNVSFQEADLRDSDFSGSDLEEVIFSRADLSGADLSGVIRAENCNWKGAKFNAKSRLPFARDEAIQRHGMIWKE